MEIAQAAESAGKIRENQGEDRNAGYDWMTHVAHTPKSF